MQVLINWLNSFYGFIVDIVHFFVRIFYEILVELSKLLIWLLTQLVHVLDLVIFNFLSPIINLLANMGFPCALCVDTLLDSVSALKSGSWAVSLSSGYSINPYSYINLFNYLLGMVNIPFAFDAIFCAMIAKFLLRRIPVIG